MARQIGTPLILFFSTHLSLITSTTSQNKPTFLGYDCGSFRDNYTENSPFQTNLLNAFSNLTSLSSSNTFSHIFVGIREDAPNKVFALYNCRNDLSSETCHQCVEDAAKNLLQLCLPSKEAIAVYEECMLRYANRPIFTIMEHWPYYFACEIGIPDEGQLRRTIEPIFRRLIDEATSENSSSYLHSHIFYNVTVGSDDDEANKVYALYDCRNDVSLEICHGCIEDATKNALDLCYRQPKEAIVIYEECMLRYANRMIFSTMELRPNYTNCAGVKLLFNSGEIEVRVRWNLEFLIDEATSESSSSRYFAVKKGSYIAQRDYYFLVQCTPDLSRTQCKECLINALNFTVESCASDGRLWGQIREPSCQMRYDDAPFFNVSSILIPPTTSPVPPDFSGQPYLVSMPKLSISLLMFILSLW